MNVKGGKFARDNVEERDKFISKAKKEIKFLTVKEVGTSREGEREPVLLFRGKKVCQLAFSKVAFFSQYRFGKDGRSIFKPIDSDSLQVAYDWLTQRVQEIEDQLQKSQNVNQSKKVPQNE